MRTCVFVSKTEISTDGGQIRVVLRRYGYELHLDHDIPQHTLDHDDMLLVDTRHVTREFYSRLAATVAQRRPSCVIAIIDRDQSTAHKLALLEAGVDILVPWDTTALELRLTEALKELIRREREA